MRAGRDALSMERPTRWMLAIAAVVAALDAASKSVARAELPLSAPSHPRGLHFFGVAGLERVANAGSALGFAQGGAGWMPLAALGLVVVLGLSRVRAPRQRVVTAAGLLAGGALGNLLDRVRFHAVTDFILIGSSHGGIVLNPADLALVTGVLLALACRHPAATQRSDPPPLGASRCAATPTPQSSD